MADPRLERLRQIDAEATPGLWAVPSDDLHQVLPEAWVDADIYPSDLIVAIHNTADAALIAAMRNAWPAVVALVEEVVGMSPAAECGDCQKKAALAVLDSIGEQP